MPIRFLCENSDCCKPLRVRDDLAGKRVKCPQCGQLVTAPTSSSAVKAMKEPAKPASKAVSPAANAKQQRLDALAEELDALPEDGDMLKGVMLTTLKALGMALPVLAGSTAQGDALKNADDSLHSAVKVLGANHRAVVIIRKMLATIRE